jgi:hypothetical protein
MDILGFLTELYSERDRLNNAIAALEALNGITLSPAKSTAKAAAPTPGTQPTAKKRVISAEGRKRIADAQKARWAKKKRAAKYAAKKAATVIPAAVTPAKAAPVAAAPVKGAWKPTSPATKKKLAAAAKASWAAKKAKS